MVFVAAFQISAVWFYNRKVWGMNLCVWGSKESQKLRSLWWKCAAVIACTWTLESVYLTLLQCYGRSSQTVFFLFFLINEHLS